MSTLVWSCAEVSVGSIALQPEGEREVLWLSGEVDSGLVEDFQAVHPDPVLVDAIDAGAVTFICARGAALIAACTRASLRAGRPAVLRRSSRIVDRVIELTALPIDPDCR